MLRALKNRKPFLSSGVMRSAQSCHDVSRGTHHIILKFFIVKAFSLGSPFALWSQRSKPLGREKAWIRG